MAELIAQARLLFSGDVFIAAPDNIARNAVRKGGNGSCQTRRKFVNCMCLKVMSSNRFTYLTRHRWNAHDVIKGTVNLILASARAQIERSEEHTSELQQQSF